MRELKYFVACSVDRFIARDDGSFDFFLQSGEHITDLIRNYPETFPSHLRVALGVEGENRVFDTVLMGYRTYKVGLDVGATNPYSHLKQFVFSRTLEQSPHPNVTLQREDPVAFVKDLKNQAGKDIWLCGGAELAATLFSEIDELILKIHPVLAGSGIPLFARPVAQTALKLAEFRTLSSGFVFCRYRLRP